MRFLIAPQTPNTNKKVIPKIFILFNPCLGFLSPVTEHHDLLFQMLETFGLECLCLELQIVVLFDSFVNRALKQIEVFWLYFA